MTQCLAGTDGVFVAASDYVKALPASIAPWIPGPPVALGTDGFGRSDGRAALRHFFEVDAAHIAVAALEALAREGAIGPGRRAHGDRGARDRSRRSQPGDWCRRAAMTATLRVPELGENVESVDVVRVLVAAGDTLAVDQPVIEVETEKASVEVPSTLAGLITEVHVAVGDTLHAGDPIVSVANEGAQPTPAPVQPSSEPVAATTEAALAPSEAEPVEPPAAAPAPEPERPPRPETVVLGEAPLAPRWVAPEGPRKLVPAAPSVRRFARELGVDITRVSGSGAGGRISIDDVKAFAARMLSQTAASPAGAASP